MGQIHCNQDLSNDIGVKKIYVILIWIKKNEKKTKLNIFYE